MIDEILPKFRTCPPKERKGLALELAKTGTDEAVAELINIMEGGIYTPAVHGRRHWYSLFKSCLQPEQWEYSSDDALVAMEAMGKTGNEAPNRSRAAGYHVNSKSFI